MTLLELKGKYAKLRDEIEAIDGAGVQSRAKLARLTLELDQIDSELAVLKDLARSAPTLEDVVPWSNPAGPRPKGVERRAAPR